MTNKNNYIATALLTLLCAATFFFTSFDPAQADKSNIITQNKSRAPTVDIMLGKAEMVSIGGNVADVLVADPSVVDVMAVKSNRLYLVGSALGDTNIMALDNEGNILKKINVHVQMDTNRLEEMIHKLYPNEHVEMQAFSDQLVLTGDVSNPSVANKLTNLVARYVADAQGIASAEADNVVVNMMGVRGEQQVMLKVKIVEASRSALKDLGLEANSAGGAGIGELGLAATTATALGLGAPTQLGVAALNYSSGDFGNLSFLARALEQEGIVNTLAEPNLTAISGEQAGFLAGGEFPIPTSLDRNGNVVYEFRPFGVSLNFKPVVMSQDRISLQLTTEVSTTSFDNNLQLNGVNVPTFNVRRAETNVELPSGGTLMIAGLISSNSISSLTQLPGVGDIPIVGDLIKSDTFNRSESEVVVIITPYLVKPFARNVTANAGSQMSSNTLGDTEMSFGALELDTPILPVIPPRKPQNQNSQLSNAFTNNMRRLYDGNVPADLMKDNTNFGYVLD
jgi:pilus assembly protein CpaC